MQGHWAGTFHGQETMKERGCGLDKRKRQIAARLKALAMTGERGSGSRGQGAGNRLLRCARNDEKRGFK